MKNLRKAQWVAATLLLGMSSHALAEVQLHPIFGDHMVIQRDMKAPVWGTASPGEAVTVTFDDMKKSTKAGRDGKWRVDLDPTHAGGPFELTVKGENTITLTDVMVGEVWVCSGQSNMQWTVKQADNPDEEIAAANHPNIRLLWINRAVRGLPTDEMEGGWARCSPESVPTFSAVGYFFGRHLHKELDIPIGLISTSWGGTRAEAWTSMKTLEADSTFKPILERWEEEFSNHPKNVQAVVASIAEWLEQANQAEQDGNAIPETPKLNLPADPRSSQHRPAGLFNAMIHPLLPFAIQGAIWYQGESNAGRAYQYRKLFSAMITDWRQWWGQGDFPFLFVQLANFERHTPGEPIKEKGKGDPGESGWAELREAQAMALDLPNTGMAVTIDIGTSHDIHPGNKQDVGKRLALWALKHVHDKDGAYSGPLYESATFEDGKATITMSHTFGGLTAKGGNSLEGFAVAGKDKKWVWAEAKIVGEDEIVVWSEDVKEPVAVRYAWANDPVCNLYNKAGLPASPFRTDDWPGITVGHVSP